VFVAGVVRWPGSKSFAEHLVRQIIEHEPELRAMLRLSLERGSNEAVPLRRGDADGRVTRSRIGADRGRQHRW